LTQRIPYPPNKGDKIRSFNEIKYLSKKHSIYLGTILDHPSDEQHVSSLRQYCKEVYAIYFNKRLRLVKSVVQDKPFSVCNFYHASLQEFVDRTLTTKKIDAVICFSSSMAEYVFNAQQYKKNHLNGARLIMDYIDLDSDKWSQYATYSKFPLKQIYQLEQKRLFEYEVKINQAFDESIFVAQQEVATFKQYYPRANGVLTIPNGLDIGYFTPKLERRSNPRPILVFTGVMDYFANEDGVIWFCRNILEKIRKQFPGVQFYIVGMRPTKAVRNLANIAGVTVTGYSNDIREYYWKADICVVPLRIARGLQNKVLEAMATGNAVVATSNASKGIVCENNQNIVIADDAESFAERVIELLKDRERREEIARNAIANIHHNYCWEENLKEFDRLLQ
jgi:sugar transferase (PEP-CTERM/EpsH1 system associated)